MSRRTLIQLAAAVAALSIAVAPSSTWAAQPDRFEFSDSNPGTVDCVSFEDQFTDFVDARGTVSFNQSGEPVRIVIHWEHRSDDTNSVTGLTLHEHGHYTETIDLLARTDAITGNQEVMNRPGTGVVVQDVGKVVYDEDGNLVFFAGGRNHSEELRGDEVLCDALA